MHHSRCSSHSIRWQAGDFSHRLGDKRQHGNVPAELRPQPRRCLLGVCGLDNFGNSCYLNAVLQCLSSTVPLVEHLLHDDTRRELAK